MPIPSVIQVGDTGQVVAIDIDPAVEITGAQIPPPGGPYRLDDLTDVTGTALSAAGMALVKSPDGQWRGAALTGDGGGIANFQVLQATPSSTWSITHPLGRYPQVTVLDTEGRRVLPDVAYGALDSVTITHAAPLAGTAILT